MGCGGFLSLFTPSFLKPSKPGRTTSPNLRFAQRPSSPGPQISTLARASDSACGVASTPPSVVSRTRFRYEHPPTPPPHPSLMHRNSNGTSPLSPTADDELNSTTGTITATSTTPAYLPPIDSSPANLDIVGECSLSMAPPRVSNGSVTVDSSKPLSMQNSIRIVPTTLNEDNVQLALRYSQLVSGAGREEQCGSDGPDGGVAKGDPTHASQESLKEGQTTPETSDEGAAKRHERRQTGQYAGRDRVFWSGGASGAAHGHSASGKFGPLGTSSSDNENKLASADEGANPPTTSKEVNQQEESQVNRNSSFESKTDGASSSSSLASHLDMKPAMLHTQTATAGGLRLRDVQRNMKRATTSLEQLQNTAVGFGNGPRVSFAPTPPTIATTCSGNPAAPRDSAAPAPASASAAPPARISSASVAMSTSRTTTDEPRRRSARQRFSGTNLIPSAASAAVPVAANSSVSGKGKNAAGNTSRSASSQAAPRSLKSASNSQLRSATTTLNKPLPKPPVPQGNCNTAELQPRPSRSASTPTVLPQPTVLQTDVGVGLSIAGQNEDGSRIPRPRQTLQIPTEVPHRNLTPRKYIPGSIKEGQGNSSEVPQQRRFSTD